MTDKEKLEAIRAEIHRLVDVRGYDRGMANDLFTFMDSLPNEPINDELEKAANEWNAKASFTPFYMALDDKGNPYEVRQDYTTHAESFKAGAKWRKEQLIAKSVETTFNVSLPSGLYDKLWIKDCKEGDKLLIIKKDEL